MRLFSDQRALLLGSYQVTAGAQTNAQFLADEAINQAYRNISGCLPWSYLHRRTQINTVEPQFSGTIGYDTTTNVLTLTGSTWPDWAYKGLLVIDSLIYAVQTILSPTTLSLTEGRRPLVDVQSGTEYTLMQVEYELPFNFARTEDLINIANPWVTQEVQPGSLLQTERVFYNPCRPWYFMVRGSTYFEGRMAMEFAPPPDAAYTYDLAYFALPRQRTLPGPYTAGTVTISGTAVTGTGTAFTQAMVGCRLRQGTASSIPAGEFGPNGSMLESTIAVVTDATHLILQQSTTAATGIQFLIDDPVDIDRLSMDEVFCRMCEYEYSILLRDYRLATQKQQLMVMALNNARARDVRMSYREPSYVVPNWEAVAYASLGSH